MNTYNRNDDSYLEEEIIRTILKFTSLLRSRKPYGTTGDLTLAQLNCVLMIGEGDRPAMAVIASTLGLAMPTVTVMIDKLVKAGYVERYTDAQDRRVVRVGLTQQGVSIMGKIREQKSELIHTILSSLTHEQREKTRDVMTLLLQAFEENRKKYER